MNGLQWLVWPWAYDQVGSLMDGWGSGAYEMRQYTHLANATISKNISYNILQILSLYFREGVMNMLSWITHILVYVNKN